MSKSLAAHRLDRLRICLDVPPHDGQRLSEACSRLFHRQLRTLIARVLDKAQQAGGDLQISGPLTVDLGELPTLGFEKAFCQRLEQRLTECLLNYGAQAQRLSTPRPKLDPPSDPLTLLSRYLSDGDWPENAPPSARATLNTWLLADESRPAHHSVAALAHHSLNPASVSRLYHLLAPASLLQLCRCLAEVRSLTGPATLGTLQLCALRYFQRHPQSPLPVEPRAAPVLVVEGNASHAQLLGGLFGEEGPVRGAWAARLQMLWQQPVVRRILRQLLIPTVYQSLAVRLNHSAISQASRASSPGDPSPGRGSAQHEHAVSEGPLQGSAQPTRAVSQEPLQINNGGIALLWPLLPGLFERLGLTDNSTFIHAQARMNAAYWLDELIWADGQYAQWRMPLNKLLCGLPLETPLEGPLPDVQAHAVMHAWLAQLPERLPAWKHFSLSDIRQLYLQRPAWLVPRQGDFSLYILPQMYDVLLKDWPWPTEMLMLPWLLKPLDIQWCRPPDA
ncbi:contractile injection system tape measure protein [Pseudomonas sp. NPDC086251]|uniref:contractile injection system tape measure protein n=1 Tax=Pseudomonas sp. NPDC086251 TaxID=3364431 RepID=UPI0038388804